MRPGAEEPTEPSRTCEPHSCEMLSSAADLGLVCYSSNRKLIHQRYTMCDKWGFPHGLIKHCRDRRSRGGYEGWRGCENGRVSRQPAVVPPRPHHLHGHPSYSLLRLCVCGRLRGALSSVRFSSQKFPSGQGFPEIQKTAVDGGHLRNVPIPDSSMVCFLGQEIEDMST